MTVCVSLCRLCGDQVLLYNLVSQVAVSNNDEEQWSGTVTLLQQSGRSYGNCSSLLTGTPVPLDGAGTAFSLSVGPYDIDVVECDVSVHSAA